MEGIRAERRGNLAVIILDRPGHNNTLTPEMLRAIGALLDGWAADPATAGVLIQGADDRVFSVGADLGLLYRLWRGGDAPLAAAALAEEYALDHRIATYPKPVIAVLNGICMGGGAGLAMHARYRVATETTLFAMPEAAIGYFPDCGASWFLGRRLGPMGMFLGLTGSRLTAASLCDLGLATHFVPRHQLGRIDLDSLDALAAAAPGQPFSPARRATIAACFTAPGPAEVMERLAASDDEWGRGLVAVLRRQCPLSLAVTFRLFASAGGRDLAAALALDAHLSRHFVAGRDLFEGIRPVAVDKAHQPRWSHPDLESVPPDEVDAFFPAKIHSPSAATSS